MGADATFFVSLVGLAFAALLSSGGYLYRGWLASKRSTRQVLYLMLEMRHALGCHLFDPEKAKNEYLRHYIERLKTKGIKISSKDIGWQIEEMIKDHFSNVVQASKTDIEERLLSPFEEALSELAKESPVLAFRLRGKEKLELLAKVNSEYFELAKEGVVKEVNMGWAQKALHNLYDDIKIEACERMVNDLDEDIIVVSKRCGWLERVRCKKLILSGGFDVNDNMFSELDSLIDGFIERMVVAANEQSNESANEL